MKEISMEEGLITNLRNAAIFHKDHCEIESCGVSLFQLQAAARYLYRAYCLRTGKANSDIEKLIEEIPII